MTSRGTRRFRSPRVPSELGEKKERKRKRESEGEERERNVNYTVDSSLEDSRSEAPNCKLNVASEMLDCKNGSDGISKRRIP